MENRSDLYSLLTALLFPDQRNSYVAEVDMTVVYGARNRIFSEHIQVLRNQHTGTTPYGIGGVFIYFSRPVNRFSSISRIKRADTTQTCPAISNVPSFSD